MGENRKKIVSREAGEGISRRSFLKGGAALGTAAAAAGLLGGCQPSGSGELSSTGEASGAVAPDENGNVQAKW